MNKYLLLRDNKQSGPYTMEELVEKGLKAYDLVWLEGRSAAWRYPSEFDELKPHAPVVEEQPYDRFYKKSDEQNPTPSILEQRAMARAKKEAEIANAARNENKVQVEVKETKKAIPAVKETQEEVAAGANPVKKIYVTLPAAAAANSNVIIKDESRVLTEKKTNSSEEYKRFEPVPVDAKTGTEVKKEIPAVKEEAVKETAINDVYKNSGFTNTAEPEKDLYEAQNSYSVRPKKSRDTRKLVVRGLVAVCLVLGGIVIGLAISHSNNRSGNNELEKLVKQIQERQQAGQSENKSGELNTNPVSAVNADPVNNAVDESNQPDDAESRPVRELASNNKTTEQPADKNETTPPSRETRKIAGSPAGGDEDMKVTSVAMDNTNEKNRNDNQKAAIEIARKNIYALVNVEANAYKVGVLGGISELYLTVSNNSRYTLDQVSVEVKYMGPEKKVVKTQTMLFNEVAPGEQKTLEVPRSNRGVSLDYTITQINSKALGLAKAKY